MFDFTSKKQLRAENASLHHTLQQMHERNERLKKKNVLLSSEKEEAEREARILRDAEVMRVSLEHTHQSRVFKLEGDVAAEQAKNRVLLEENGILRQIIEDISGKDPDELIAVFKKVVREEAYGTAQKRDRKDDYHEDGV